MQFVLWFLLTVGLLSIAFAIGFVAEWLSHVRERRDARRRARPAPMVSYLPAAGSPVCAQCREVYAGSRVHHVTTSGWHRQAVEREWQVRAGLR
jgi:hypothetical protein